MTCADNSVYTHTITSTLEKDHHIVERLLAVPEIDVNQADNDGETPLLVACKNQDLHIGQSLLAVPEIDVNQADNDGETPLDITKGTLIHRLLESYLVGIVL